MNFNDATPEQLQAAREQRLRIREQIRARNDKRPRCAGCGADMLVFDPGDFVTAEHLASLGLQYLEEWDYRPGDLICFWCFGLMVDPAGDRHQWGRA